MNWKDHNIEIVGIHRLPITGSWAASVRVNRKGEGYAWTPLFKLYKEDGGKWSWFEPYDVPPEFVTVLDAAIKRLRGE